MREKIKTLLYFNRGERSGLFSLSLLLIVIMWLPRLYDYLLPPRKFDINYFLEKSEDLLNHADTAAYLVSGKDIANIPLDIKPFDPNVAGPGTWLAMGLPDWLGVRIEKYKKAGGKFRVRKDLSKIFGFKEEWYNKLAPFILLPDTVAKAKTLGQYKEKSIDVLNLNKADSASLTGIPGIGPTFARRIIKYRERLGGFYDEGQLLEVYGLDSEKLLRIKRWIVVSPGDVRKIDLNHCSFRDLARHPYCGYENAKIISRLKAAIGYFTDPEDLNKSDLLPDSVYNKLFPYLVVTK